MSTTCPHCNGQIVLKACKPEPPPPNPIAEKYTYYTVQNDAPYLSVYDKSSDMARRLSTLKVFENLPIFNSSGHISDKFVNYFAEQLMVLHRDMIILDWRKHSKPFKLVVFVEVDKPFSGYKYCAMFNKNNNHTKELMALYNEEWGTDFEYIP